MKKNSSKNHQKKIPLHYVSGLSLYNLAYS